MDWWIFLRQHLLYFSMFSLCSKCCSQNFTWFWVSDKICKKNFDVFGSHVFVSDLIIPSQNINQPYLLAPYRILIWLIKFFDWSWWNVSTSDRFITDGLYIKKFIISKFRLKQSKAAITCSKFNNENPRTRCEICSKLTIKTPEQHHLLLTLNIFYSLFYCFYCQIWAGKCRLGLFFMLIYIIVFFRIIIKIIGIE